MRLIRIALLAVCAITGLPADGQTARLADFRSVDLALPDLPDGAFSLTIDAHGRRLVLRLSEHRGLLDAMPAAQRSRIPRGDRFLAGDIEGIPGSWARINRIAGRISGGFFDGEELWLIDRAGQLSLPPDRRAPASALLLYRYSDLRLDGLIDHGAVDVMRAVKRAIDPDNLFNPGKIFPAHTDRHFHGAC